MPKSNDPRVAGRPSEDAIARRAYELYLQRGSVPGYELDDWLQAEADLTAQAVTSESSGKTSSDGSDEQPAVRRRGSRREAVPSSPSSRRV